jgi:hypothetical protein
MADFFKGLAGGFGTGLQFGRAMRERRMEDDLAKAYAKPEEYVDYTPEQTREIQRLQETGAYDVQALPGAEGAAPTLRYTPRQGLDLGQGEMPAAPTDIAPGQVQRYGGRTTAGQFNPTELRGLQMQEAARVLGSYGDAKGAAALQAQAEEQAYQAKYRPLQLKQLEGNIAGQEQQRELTGIQLGSAKRTEAEQLNASNFSAFAAENPNLSTAELKDAAFKQFKFSPKQWQDAVNTRLGISDTEQKLFVSGVKDKLKGKNLQQLGSLYNSDPDFDDKTDLAIVPGKNGAVTLNFIDKATNKITGSQTFNNEALATEYLNKQATEPETIGSWMLALQKNQAAINASNASASKDRAIGSAYADGSRGGKGGLKQKVADFKEVYGRDPTEAEKGILAGLTNKPREYTAADVNARAKLMIDGGMADPDDPTKPLSPQRAIQIATSELSGVPYVSPVDQLIKDIADARNANKGNPPAAGAPATTPAAAPAPRGPASLGPDPSRPQPGVSPVTGLSRETPVQAPNVVAAVGRGLDAGQERYKVYLETKIANKQPLTADEKLRAKRLGLQ